MLSVEVLSFIFDIFCFENKEMLFPIFEIV